MNNSSACALPSSRLLWCARLVSPVVVCFAVAVHVLPAHAQAPSGPVQLPTEAPGPVGGVPDKLPELQLPTADQLRLVVPRPVKAATAALGFGRQRLALVVGIGTLGSRQVLDSAPRDSLAVASALRSAGFVVMVREDATGTDLRAALKEFRERLQPGGMGLLYVTALGAQVEGRNLLLPREAVVDSASSAAAISEHLLRQGVPVQDLVDALLGTAESPRMLVVDAAYKHPALNKLPQPGLAAQPLPPGMMALFAQSPLAVQEVPAVAPLPTPTPTDPQLLAASPFARLLVRSVLTPKLSGAEVLRSTHRAMVDTTQGAVNPWLAGDTDAKEEMAELSLLDAVLPRTPEEYAREAAKRAVAQMVKPAAARVGEAPATELLQQAQDAAPPGQAPGAPGAPADNTRTSSPELPANGNTLGSAANALGSAASVAGTVAGVAGTAATVALGLKATQAGAAATVASTATSSLVGAATAVAGNAVALATRLGSGGSGESGARQAVAAAATATSATSTASTALPAARTVGTANTARNLAATVGEMSVSEVLQGSPAAPTRAQPANNRSPAAPPANQPQATDGRTTRNPEGGERPVYTPRSNSFGYAEGDTFSYQVTDTWKGEVTSRYTTAIEEVLDNGQMLANGHQVALDAQGRLKSLRQLDGSLQRFEPHQDLWWSKPTPGQSRDVDFKEIFERADNTRGQTQFKGSSSVGRLQKIETPAGEFDALPIETSGWYHETLSNGASTSGKFERTVWYSPQLGHPVAIDIKDVDRLGKLLKRERVELTHAQQVRNAQ